MAQQTNWLVACVRGCVAVWLRRYGGSFSVWNPETQIALAYVPNAISNDLIGGGRANRIIAAMTTTLEKEDAV